MHYNGGMRIDISPTLKNDPALARVLAHYIASGDYDHIIAADPNLRMVRRRKGALYIGRTWSDVVLEKDTERYPVHGSRVLLIANVIHLYDTRGKLADAYTLNDAFEWLTVVPLGEAYMRVSEAAA